MVELKPFTYGATTKFLQETDDIYQNIDKYDGGKSSTTAVQQIPGS